MILDYETLKILWWLFIGLLLIGFVWTAGFDLGVGTLLPFLGSKDEERRVIINSIGPTWEGNQVWLILGAGAVFAAWPVVYAAAFSGFYGVMLLALFALVLRPGGFTYRSKLENPRWRGAWDWTLFVGGAVPAAVFGIVFGNLFLGVPIEYDDTLRVFYTGSLWHLFNPFALLTGLISLAMLIMHGAVYLQLRTDNDIAARASRAAQLFGIVFLVGFALAGLWVAFGIEGYRIVAIPDTNTSLTPLQKTVERATGAWLDNYARYPWMLLAPAAGFGGALGAILLARRKRPELAFIVSCICLAGVLLTAGLSLFPFMMPSSIEPNHSLTVWDAGSSHLTLTWIFVATVVFLPIIVAYTSWVFRVMRGKVTAENISENEHTAY